MITGELKARWNDAKKPALSSKEPPARKVGECRENMICCGEAAWVSEQDETAVERSPSSGIARLAVATHQRG